MLSALTVSSLTAIIQTWIIINLKMRREIIKHVHLLLSGRLSVYQAQEIFGYN